MKGYTLIELLVSIAIFAIVMVAATAAYLSFIAYNRQAEVTGSVMNSLSFSIDAMARDIRSGTGYTDCGAGQICGNFTFADATGCTVNYDKQNQQIVRTVTQAGSCTRTAENNTPITDSSISIDTLHFFLRKGAQNGNNIEPEVTILVIGHGCVPNSDCTGPNQIPFQIETGATERLPEL